MNLEIKKLPAHNIRCVIVASEKMSSPVSDYSSLSFNGDNYAILSHTTYSNGDTIPSTLKLLATGQNIPDSHIWSVSKKIHFFIVEKI